MNKISVLIPFYMHDENSLDLLEDAIDSVISQSFRPIHLVLSNDSTDKNFIETDIFLASKLSFSKTGITYQHQRNHDTRGVASNTNSGLDSIDSGWTHILHSDDKIMNAHLYRTLSQKVKEESSSWFVLGGTVGENEFKPVINSGIFKSGLILGLNSIGGPSGVVFNYDKSFFYNAKLNNFCDLDFAYKMFINLGIPTEIPGNIINYGVGDWQVQKKFGTFELSIAELSEIISYYNFGYRDFLQAILRNRPSLHEVVPPLTAISSLKPNLIAKLLLGSILTLRFLKRRVRTIIKKR